MALSETARIIREIRRAKIREPGPDEFVDECHYSRTGWAIWQRREAGSRCTCQPAKKPRRLHEGPGQ